VVVRSIALFRVGRDNGVTALDMRISGLRETDAELSRHAGELNAIQEELAGVMPKLKDMYALDLVLEDSLRRRYIARLYTHGGIVHYALLISPHGTLRKVAKRLAQQGWELLVFIERLVRASAASGAGSESARY
jgi:hypothetical protein